MAERFQIRMRERRRSDRRKCMMWVEADRRVADRRSGCDRRQGIYFQKTGQAAERPEYQEALSA